MCITKTPGSELTRLTHPPKSGFHVRILPIKGNWLSYDGWSVILGVITPLSVSVSYTLIHTTLLRNTLLTPTVFSLPPTLRVRTTSSLSDLPLMGHPSPRTHPLSPDVPLLQSQTVPSWEKLWLKKTITGCSDVLTHGIVGNLTTVLLSKRGNERSEW